MLILLVLADLHSTILHIQPQGCSSRCLCTPQTPHLLAGLNCLISAATSPPRRIVWIAPRRLVWFRLKGPLRFPFWVRPSILAVCIRSPVHFVYLSQKSPSHAVSRACARVCTLYAELRALPETLQRSTCSRPQRPRPITSSRSHPSQGPTFSCSS